jgi:hypothetical protein
MAPPAGQAWIKQRTTRQHDVREDVVVLAEEAAAAVVARVAAPQAAVAKVRAAVEAARARPDVVARVAWMNEVAHFFTGCLA